MRDNTPEQVRLLDSCDDPHCNPSCQGSVHPGRRGEADSWFSWVLVLITLTVAIIILGAGEVKMVGWFLSLTKGRALEGDIASRIPYMERVRTLT